MNENPLITWIVYRNLLRMSDGTYQIKQLRIE